MNKERKKLIKYLLIAGLIFSVSTVISVFTGFIILNKCDLSCFTNEQLAIALGLIDGVISAIGTGLVLYQLRSGSDSDKRKNNIEEAQFILQYNQAFIQDNNMTFVERKLEQFFTGQTKDPIITEENHQKFINYLVYLEGLVPLILNDVISLKHVDDLFAYRYFLAVNNSEIQQKELFEFAEYYRGCFKLYKKWKDYRLDRGLKIPMEETSLDKWPYFELFSSENVTIRSVIEKDDFRKIAELIYYTDEYIYPAAFKKVSIAKKVIPQLLNKDVGIFKKDNIRVAIVDNKIVGVVLMLSKKDFSTVDIATLKKEIKLLPTSFADVYEEYFNKLIVDFNKTEDNIYIACVCVDKKQRGKHIGKKLVKSIIREFPDKSLELHVLEDNKNAIQLYKDCGFVLSGESEDGYAYKEKAPVCRKMVYERIDQSIKK